MPGNKNGQNEKSTTIRIRLRLYTVTNHVIFHQWNLNPTHRWWYLTLLTRATVSYIFCESHRFAVMLDPCWLRSDWPSSLYQCLSGKMWRVSESAATEVVITAYKLGISKIGGEMQSSCPLGVAMRGSAAGPLFSGRFLFLFSLVFLFFDSSFPVRDRLTIKLTVEFHFWKHASGL